MPFRSRAMPNAVCLALASALALGGCASPYVTSSDLVYGKPVQSVSLPEARAMLASYHAAYRAKILVAGQEERVLSNGLITLGGLVLGLAAAKVHPSTIAGAAITGGLGYSLGTANIDKRRAQIYWVGMKALECADDAVAPLVLSEGTAKTIDQDLKELRAAFRATEANAGRVVAALVAAAPQAPWTDGALDTARKALAASSETVDQAAKTQAAVNALLRKRDDAGTQLAMAVRAIDTDVLEGIRITDASLQAVPGIIAKLSADATVFSNLAKTPASAAAQGGAAGTPHGKNLVKPEDYAPTKQERDALERLAAAVGKLAQSTSTLDAVAESLAGFVKGIEAGFSADRLKTCKVDNLPVAMVASPASLSFAVSTADTQMLSLRGGKQGYTAQFVQSSHPGLSIDPPSPFLRTDVVAVSATKDVAAGDYQIMVRDAGEQFQLVKVRVGATAAKAADPSPAATPTPDDWAKLLAQINPLAVATGVKVTLRYVESRTDGGPGLSYAAEAGKSATGEEVKTALKKNEQFAKLLAGKSFEVTRALGEAPQSNDLPGRFGSTVSTLPVGKIKAIQSALCLSGAWVDGKWGMRSQAALLKARERRPVDGSDKAAQGFLTDKEASALLQRAAADVAKDCAP